MAKLSPLSIYIHVPFCEKKNNFSGFLSIDDAAPQQVDAYVNALVNEIKSYASKIGKNYRVGTIFLGGGDPAFLTPKQISKIMGCVYQNFKLAKNPEITIEAAPSSITIPKLKCWKSLGINRLSIMFLSYDEIILRTLGASHRTHQGIFATKLAKKYGFDNINLDIIFDVPISKDMADRGIRRDIRVELGAVLREVPFVTHISTYAVVPEEGTLMMRKLDYEELYELDDEASIDEEFGIVEALEDFGFSRYEVTSWSRTGFKSKHNQAYWTGIREYLGLGLGAAGLMNGERYENTEDLNMYLLNPQKVAFRHPRTRKDIINEILMLGLRTKQGVKLGTLSELGYNIIRERAGEIMELRDMNLVKTTKTTLKATTEGMLILNMLIDRLQIKDREQEQG